MDSVRAKFRCDSIEKNEYNSNAHLVTVHSNTVKNKDFTKFTPNADLKIMIMNDAPASEFFVPGEFYYSDFTVAPKE